MILQTGLAAVEAIELGGQVLRALGGPNLSVFRGGAFTLGGFVAQQIAGLFRRRSPRLSGTDRAEVLRAQQVARITNDTIVRVADPFRARTLGIFRESQAPIAEQLFFEAARRREAARQQRLNPISRSPLPDFSPQRVAEIQRLFASTATAAERLTDERAPPGSKRFRARIASGLSTARSS